MARPINLQGAKKKHSCPEKLETPELARCVAVVIFKLLQQRNVPYLELLSIFAHYFFSVGQQ